jgi:hypothetical protein
MDVCLLCVLSGRGLCDELITRPEESYRLWRVIVCDQDISCEEEAKKKRTEPLGNACSKTQLSNFGQNKITCSSLDWVLSKCKRHCVSLKKSFSAQEGFCAKDDSLLRVYDSVTLIMNKYLSLHCQKFSYLSHAATTNKFNTRQVINTSVQSSSQQLNETPETS